MTFGKTALRCWLPAAALLLALLCPLPVAAARAGTAIPVSVRTDGAAADAVYTVELTPLDAAPAPVQRALTVKNGGTVYFTGFAFDEPGGLPVSGCRAQRRRCPHDLRCTQLHGHGPGDGPPGRRSCRRALGRAQRGDREGRQRTVCEPV